MARRTRDGRSVARSKMNWLESSSVLIMIIIIHIVSICCRACYISAMGRGEQRTTGDREQKRPTRDTEQKGTTKDRGQVHPDLARDTDWLASRLSDGNAPPPGGEKDLLSAYNELIVATHEATPHKRLIKEYLVVQEEALPGVIKSSKGKRTKLSYLVEAVDNGTLKLFKQVDHCLQQTHCGLDEDATRHEQQRRCKCCRRLSNLGLSF